MHPVDIWNPVVANENRLQLVLVSRQLDLADGERLTANSLFSSW